MRIAATADLHFGKSSTGLLQPLLSQITTGADVLVMAGDLTDYGTADEARNLVKDLAVSVKIPIVAVLGNHDFEAGAERDIQKILIDHGVCILDGDTCEVQGVGFAGVKGFAGGFGRRALGPWGEPIIKQFVHEAVNEALKLESALARLRTDKKIVVMHYAPVQSTVEGEPCEIYPYLGCSRLEEPLTRYAVTAVVHGHAHNGKPEGRTSTDVPVYNVAYPLLRKLTPQQPFRILEI
jgi:Icc-related predicted phosphoesterase